MPTSLALLSLLPWLLATSSAAPVDARVAYLSRQLHQGKDPRIRAQSALVLGATDDPDAVQALCQSLNADPSELVRAASAKALASLQEVSALPCLAAQAQDAVPETRQAVLDAMAALTQRKSQAPRFYLVFAGVTDAGAALSPDLLHLVEARLRRKLEGRGALLAPSGESKARTKAFLKKNRIKGYRLTAELHSEPQGGLRIALVCMSYPEQSLLGQVEVKAAGAKAADLIRALAPKAVEEAADTFEWSP